MLATLNELIPGLAKVLERADIFRHPAGIGYCTKINEWVLQEEAANLTEIAEQFKTVADFARIKALPRARLQEALDEVLAESLC